MSEENNNNGPSRPALAQDFIRLKGSALRGKIGELQDRVSWQQKQTEDYKKKCATLVRTAKAMREPSQKVDKELTQYRDGVQDSLQNLRRNKDSIFKALLYATNGGMERAQKVRDMANETATQMEKARRTVERMKAKKKEENTCCAAAPGGQVPKRFPETLKIAAFAEINAMLTRSGIASEAKTFLAAGKKFANCIMKCMERGPGKCIKKLKCGLALPSDSVLVQSTKRCAIQAGFNTPSVQQLCQCVASSGVRNLTPLCSRIQIS